MEIEVRETIQMLEFLKLLKIAPEEVQVLIEQIDLYDYSNCPCCEQDTEYDDSDFV